VVASLAVCGTGAIARVGAAAFRAAKSVFIPD